MSDLTALFEGKFGSNPLEAVPAFFAKAYADLTGYVEKLPADIKPVAQEVIKDAEIVLTDAAQWAGTAAAAVVSAQSDGLSTLVFNVLSHALGGADPTSAAARDTIQAVNKLLQGVIVHAVTDFTQGVSAPK